MILRRLAASAVSFVLHVLVVATVVRLASVTRGAGTADTRVEVVRQVILPPVELPPEGELAGLTPGADAQPIVPPPDGSTEVAFPGFTFDYRKVAARAPVLFPFLSPGLALAQFKLGPTQPAEPSIANPLARSNGARDGAKPRLALSTAALQRLIDRSWSRRERWSAFRPIADAILSHDPDAGSLPDLVHAYLAQNGLQPYVDGRIRDPRLWAQLGLAADHADFVDFVSRYAFTHPGTKTTTELLFLLDKLAEASLDALLTLVDSDPIPDLGWTRQTNPAAFNAVVAIRNYYKNVLHRMGLVSADDVRGFYDRARIAILSGIVRTTPRGYRASDARFLLGAIRWRQRDTMGAVRWWRELTSDPTDAYFAAYSEIEGALRSQSPPDSIFVNRVLQAEHGRWITFSAERLHQFGFHFDTF